MEVGDKVKIIKGKYSGKIGIIKGINNDSYEVDINTFDTLAYDDISKDNVVEFNGVIPDFMEDGSEPSAVTIKGGFESIKLAVYDAEGNGYPHFHFYHECKPEGGIPRSKRGKGGCICFESANYFTHAGHTETMSSKEIKAMIEFLRKPYLLFPSMFQYMIVLWNDQNPEQRQLPLGLNIPDYKATMGTIQNKIK